MEKTVSLFIFLLITIFFFNSDYFERNFFFNEIISLLGATFFLIKLSVAKEFIIKKDTYSFYILIFAVVCAFHLFYSLNKMTSLYYYARNTVIFYSVFSFYLGYYFFERYHKIVITLRKELLSLVSISVVFFKVVLARYSGPVLLPILTGVKSLSNIILLFSLILIHSVKEDALSVAIIIPLFLLIFFSNSFKEFSRYFLIGIMAIILFFLYFYDNFMLYKTGYYNYFGNVNAIYQSHPLLAVDINITWRILLWFRYIAERFPENIIGIGFGTPMLDYIAERRSHWTGNDEIHAHVSGAHNSYLTILLRLGVAGFYAILMISRKVFKDYFKVRRLNMFKQYIPYYFVWIGMFSLIIFNLGLESPLRAGLFWVATGFVAKINTKFN
tara:strand:+ start:2881 stop:4035 length:1155 start_codon:yes stop_codon:yes gene_type:complete